MSDEAAYMALALHNAQSELSDLEVGLHALRSGLSGSEYARRSGTTQPEIARRMYAAAVADEIMSYGITLDPACWRPLAEIHAAPKWLWCALAARMVEKNWTVETTREATRRVKVAAEPPEVPQSACSGRRDRYWLRHCPATSLSAKLMANGA